MFLSTLTVLDILPRNTSLFNASHQKPVVWYLIVFPYYRKWYFFAAVRHFRRSQIRIQKRQIQWVDIPFTHSSKSSSKVVLGNQHRYHKLCNHSHFKLKLSWVTRYQNFYIELLLYYTETNLDWMKLCTYKLISKLLSQALKGIQK